MIILEKLTTSGGVSILSSNLDGEVVYTIYIYKRERSEPFQTSGDARLDLSTILFSGKVWVMKE